MTMPKEAEKKMVLLDNNFEDFLTSGPSAEYISWKVGVAGERDPD
jgi:hypothetical protein